MNSQNGTWESLKTDYLRQVEKALSLVNHPRTKDVLADVSSHLDRRFAELSADERSWENFQAIITDMGAPCEYAELLDAGPKVKKQRPSLKFVVLVAVVLAIVAAAILILPKYLGKQFDPNTIVPGVRVGPYKLGMSENDVLDSLGKPKMIFYGEEKYTLNNLPRTYFMVFDGISFGIDDGLVKGIGVHSPRYKFVNGLGVGDSEQKIKQAFGDDFQFEESPSKDFLTYRDKGLQFEIHKKNRTVMEMSVSQKIAHEPSSSKIQQPEPDAFKIQRRTLPHPLINDPRILGNWESVDFVRFVGDFEPGTKQKQGELFLKKLTFMKNGSTSLGNTWTKGWIWHSNGRTKAQYEIKVIDGEHYLFFPWFPDANRNKLPYYVLKKASSAHTLSPDTQDRAKKPAINTTINAKVAQLDMDTATLDDVIRIFGEPEKYSLWNNKIFTKDNLPSIYIAWYSDSFRVLMSNGKINELRFSQPRIGYVYKGKLQIGSSLKEAFDVLGKPSTTVVGQPMGVEDGVLYKDINGRKGHCCYMRADQKVRLFFRDYKVSGIYLSRNKYRSPGQREKSPLEHSETNTRETCHDQTV